MPLLDHLGELRRRFTIVVVAIFIAAIVVYLATPTLIDLMMDPIREALRGRDLVVLSVLGGFTIRFQVAIFFSVIICVPIIIWEIMAFFLPALKPSERKWVLPTVMAMIALFFIGMVFCYFVVQPAAFGWLLDQTFEFAQATPDAVNFLQIFMLLEIGFGFAFQMPLFVFYLSIFHIVPYKVFRDQWRFIYIGLMVISAVVTPDASPVTMMLMFVALVMLYEIALLFARIVVTSRDGKAALKWSRDDYTQNEIDKV